MILVTGGSGQVGHALASELPRAGFKGVQVFSGRNELDLGDADQLRRSIRSLAPQVIINPAAYTAVDQAESEDKRAMQINGHAPHVLAEEAKRLGALLVHYSTDYVFPGTGTTPYVETDKTGPINTYGQSKLAGEEAIRATGCDAVILRTQWVFSDFGQNFVKTMLRLGAERETLRIVADQIGSPTSALFLARMTAHALHTLTKEGGRAGKLGTYHLACSGWTSWYEFAKAVFTKAKGRGAKLKVNLVEPILTADYPTPARRPHNSRLACEKFQKAFDVPKLQSWDAALDEALASLVHS